MLDNNDKETLLKLARESITYALSHGCMIDVSIENYSPALRSEGASFVTLHNNKQLRGCIGTLSPYRALVTDVAHNAFNAAFHDPRFTSLRPDELQTTHIHIEVLSPTETIHFKSEIELLDKLRPGVDGLILRQDGHTGTFLPSVWSQLPEPEVFLQELKRKAGLNSNYWSDSITIERYTTIAFEEIKPE